MYIVKFNCYSIRKLQHNISIYNKVKIITDVKVVKNVNATKASSEDIYQYNQIQKVLVLQKNKIIQKKKKWINKTSHPLTYCLIAWASVLSCRKKSWFRYLSVAARRYSPTLKAENVIKHSSNIMGTVINLLSNALRFNIVCSKKVVAAIISASCSPIIANIESWNKWRLLGKRKSRGHIYHRNLRWWHHPFFMNNALKQIKVLKIITF